MSFTPDQIGLLTWAVRDVISRRRLDGRASWSTLRALEEIYRQLTISVDGSESEAVAEESQTNDLIDSKAAAEIIGCTPRWVIEIRGDLDGRKVSGRWVFPRAVVMEYAELKGIDRDGNRIPPTRGGAVPPRVA